MKKIIIDIYGADLGTDPVINGIIKAKKECGFTPVFVGDENLITSKMEQNGLSANDYEVIHTTDYIKNTEPPTVIFGGRDDSSIALAYKKLKEDDEAVALISAGNTGALLVGSICRLGLLPSIKAPCLSSALPCAGENLVILVDCGSAIDCTANDLVRFAKMGEVFSRCYCDIKSPRIGLLSVGREKGKGSKLTNEAFEKLSELPLNFVGNLEGSDLVSGYADVVVADGFSGNILLKSTEAAGKKAMAVIDALDITDEETVLKIKTALFETFDFNSRGAATFLGTKKIVTKMHGSANEDTTVSTVKQILRLEKADFLGELSKALS